MQGESLENRPNTLGEDSPVIYTNTGSDPEIDSFMERLSAEPLTEDDGFILSLALDTRIDPDRQEAEQYVLPEGAPSEEALEGFLRGRGFSPILDGLVQTSDLKQQRHWKLFEIYSLYHDQQAKTNFEASLKPNS